MNVHEYSQVLRDLLDAGWVEVGRVHYAAGFSRVNLEAPATTCLHRLRPWSVQRYPEYNNGIVREEQHGFCLLPKGHKGKRHTTVVFYCDGCGRTQRGSAAYSDDSVSLCFLCKNGIPASRV